MWNYLSTLASSDTFEAQKIQGQIIIISIDQNELNNELLLKM